MKRLAMVFMLVVMAFSSAGCAKSVRMPVVEDNAELSNIVKKIYVQTDKFEKAYIEWVLDKKAGPFAGEKLYRAERSLVPVIRDEFEYTKYRIVETLFEGADGVMFTVNKIKNLETLVLQVDNNWSAEMTHYWENVSMLTNQLLSMMHILQPITTLSQH